MYLALDYVEISEVQSGVVVVQAVVCVWVTICLRTHNQRSCLSIPKICLVHFQCFQGVHRIWSPFLVHWTKRWQLNARAHILSLTNNWWYCACWMNKRWISAPGFFCVLIKMSFQTAGLIQRESCTNANMWCNTCTSLAYWVPVMLLRSVPKKRGIPPCRLQPDGQR
jgi:hypothetical protein